MSSFVPPEPLPAASAVSPPTAAPAGVQVYDFDEVHEIVKKELLDNKEKWIGERTDPTFSSARYQALPVPMMRLIGGRTIRDVLHGRIPRSSEVGADGKPYWITLQDLTEQPRNGLDGITLAFFSHRWCNPTTSVSGAVGDDWTADDATNTKGKALIKLTNYLASAYKVDAY